MSSLATTSVRGGRVIDHLTRSQDFADILIVDDTIIEVGPSGMPAPGDARLVNAADRAILPGLVNGHVHGHGTLAKGLVEDRWPLELFLTALPGLSGNHTLEDKYLSGLLCAVEMIRKGCTACYDLFFEFPMPSRQGIEAVGRAYSDAGVRAVIAPMVADVTLYQAYPGLMDTIPEPLRIQADRLRLAPHEASAEALRTWTCSPTRWRTAP